MWSILLMVVAVVLVAWLVFAATRPATFRVQRSVRIEAMPEDVFPHISDLHAWAAWSPWERKDPAMTRRYSGAPSGEGAVFEWRGNREVGAGRMEITDVIEPSRVVIRLDFLEPFEAHNTAEFTLRADGSATTVSWAIHGPSPFLSRLMGVFFNMDRLIGKDFEAGLASLKSLVETPRAA